MTVFKTARSRARLLVLALALTTAEVAADQLPERAIDLKGIGENQCQQVEWRLPHTELPVAICHLPAPAASDAASAGRNFTADVPALRLQALALRESWVSDELATAVYTMQATLDALPHRNLHPEWRVFINLGTFGCVPRIAAGNGRVGFTDPCNQNSYDADGRPLTKGYPALSIPPYIIQGEQLILGRMPANLAKPEGLPSISFDATSDTNAAEQLVRAARWGNISSVGALLDAGTDINSIVKGGSTALLIAVQMRQEEMVAFLVGKGADVNLRYPDGLSALDMAKVVKAPKLETMLLKAGAMTSREKSSEQKLR